MWNVSACCLVRYSSHTIEYSVFGCALFVNVQYLAQYRTVRHADSCVRRRSSSSISVPQLLVSICVVEQYLGDCVLTHSVRRSRCISVNTALPDMQVGASDSDRRPFFVWHVGACHLVQYSLNESANTVSHRQCATISQYLIGIPTVHHANGCSGDAQAVRLPDAF